MTILLTGGGTGGHITPLLAVAHELKRLKPKVRLVYVGERGGKFRHLTADSKFIDESYFVSAGKFRRYHGRSWLRRLLDVRTNLLNIRDLPRVFMGFWQALILLRKVKPDVVFIKGGFVGVPVGLAAAINRVPFITHDSDTVPGLANRIVGRWSRWHATGMPEEFYNYPKSKTRYVGIPLAAHYVGVDEDLKREYKRHLNIPVKSRVLLVTGGSQGARNLNHIVKQSIPDLMLNDDRLYVIHQAGQGNSSLYNGMDVDLERLLVHDFISDMFRYSGAADLIVTRGGASSIAEFSVQGKACVIIPHPYLTGGHQIKNAKSLERKDAAVVLDETALLDDASVLTTTIKSLFDEPERRQVLEKNLRTLARTDAANRIAELIIETAV